MYHINEFWKNYVKVQFAHSHNFLIDFFLLILPLCSTFSNDSHVDWSAGTSETFFKLETMRMIVARFGSVVSEKKIF
jgi:hypothetical protein